MVEAVGQRWWGAYLDCIARNLKPGGRAALQFICIDHGLFDGYARNADFIQTYIFPGGMLINEPQFAALATERGLSWEDRDGFGQRLCRDAEALAGAVRRGRRARRRSTASARNSTSLWRYYLMYCEGGFRGGAIDVAQVTLVKA